MFTILELVLMSPMTFLISLVTTFLITSIGLFLINKTPYSTIEKGLTSIFMGLIFFLTGRLFQHLSASTNDLTLSLLIIANIIISGFLIALIGSLLFLFIKNKPLTNLKK